jgi:hypothetical protein
MSGPSELNHLISQTDRLIKHVPAGSTLESQHVIAAEMASAMGLCMKPSKWLVAGDVRRVSIDGLGEIQTTVILESSKSKRADWIAVARDRMPSVNGEKGGVRQIQWTQSNYSYLWQEDSLPAW